MISFERIFVEIRELSPDDLNRWIADNLVRPLGTPGAYQFQEIDVARIKLIMTLRDELEVGEPALPTVLSLLDQLYDLRRQMRRLNEAVETTVPLEIRKALLRHLDG
ncbi:MAG TPA: chaperone modulator CbpM [Acidocella sp.]|nr:chaperone modulator CbpM [Acidocella sp.]HQT40235.1 chaperone modulator CbpM [Acidocella sp.]